MIVKRLPIRIEPDPTRVILQFLDLNQESRVNSLLDKVFSLTENEVMLILKEVLAEFESRHAYIEKPLAGSENEQSYFRKILLANFAKIKDHLDKYSKISLNRKLLIGAYCTKEYSVESAALFNPSIVPHPVQSDPEALKFIISLRATGEGHISSIEFRTGTINASSEIILDEKGDYLITPDKKNNNITKKFIAERVNNLPGFNPNALASLPDSFKAGELGALTNKTNTDSFELDVLKDMVNCDYDLEFTHHVPLSARVIFPSANCEAMGMEDVRFVKFTDQGTSCYYATYTAYDGTSIKSQLLETTDFVEFKIRSLYGQSVHDKGMALFPRKVNGKYAMISRQDGENISIMFSNQLYYWDKSTKLDIPLKYWGFTQTGNCGSPIETAYGWLLITHAVGPLRKYVLSASLLDLEDPSRVLGTLDEPLMTANTKEREGYVPNVLYSCGAMIHNGKLILPYAMSDSATGFATVSMDQLLAKLLKSS